MCETQFIATSVRIYPQVSVYDANGDRSLKSMQVHRVEGLLGLAPLSNHRYYTLGIVAMVKSLVLDKWIN